MYAAAISDGNTYIYEDVRTGIVFTTDGSLPDSDEIEHVKAYHAGKFCPIMGERTGCRYMLIGDIENAITHANVLRRGTGG